MELFLFCLLVLSLKYNAIDVSLDINSLYLTLETLNDVEASLNATLKHQYPCLNDFLFFCPNDYLILELHP